MKRRATRTIKVLAGTAVLALALAPTTATAQEGEGLSGYVGMASGAAWSVQPIFPGLLPTGDAPFEITYALSTANVQSGGNSLALASLLWPGSAAANIGPLLGAASADVAPIAGQLPPYPVMAQANQDDGEVEVGGRPGPWMRAIGRPSGSEGNAQTGGTGLPALVDADAISSVSRSMVEDGKLIAESVVTLEGVRIAGGVITIDTVRSISSATSDGTTSTSTGSTNFSGLKIEGVEAVLTGEGVQAKEVPGAEEGLPGIDAVTEALSLADVLEQAGISISTTPADGRSEGPAADYAGTALYITMQNPAAALNPQFAGSRFEITLAATSVGATASPPFDFAFEDEFDFEETLSGAAGFDDITGTTQQTIRQSTVSVGGTSGSSGGSSSSGGRGPAAIVTQPLGSALEYVGGVTPALVAGWAFAAVIGARWVSRYVGRIVSIEE